MLLSTLPSLSGTEVFEHPEFSDLSILNKFYFSAEDPLWLWIPIELWPDLTKYQKLKIFVRQIKAVHKEHDRQDLIAVQRYRHIL